MWSATASWRLARNSGIGFVPWGPVGMGYLTGTMDGNTKLDSKDGPAHSIRAFSPANLAANMPIVEPDQAYG